MPINALFICLFLSILALSPCLLYFELNTCFHFIWSIPFLIFINHFSHCFHTFSFLYFSLSSSIYYLLRFFEFIAFSPLMIYFELWRARIGCYRGCKRIHDSPQLSSNVFDFIVSYSSSVLLGCIFTILLIIGASRLILDPSLQLGIDRDHNLAGTGIGAGIFEF